jgi:hypothetical protein
MIGRGSLFHRHRSECVFKNRRPPVGGIPFKCPAHDFRRLSLIQNTGFAHKLRRARSNLPSRCPMQPRPDPWRRLIFPHLEPLGTILRRGRRPLPMRRPTIGRTFRRRERSVNMAKSRQAAPNATIPEDRQNHDYRASTLLRWSISKPSSAASVSESAIDEFELERRQPSAITTDAIRRAFEGVGVVFSPKTTFNCGATCRWRGDHKRRGSSGSSRLPGNVSAFTARGAAQSSTQCICVSAPRRDLTHKLPARY